MLDVLPTAPTVVCSFVERREIAGGDPLFPATLTRFAARIIARSDDKEVERADVTTRGKAVSVEPTVSGVTSALNRLRTFTSWKENWDAENSLAPDLIAIDRATVLLSLLNSSSKDYPKVTLTHDGLPMLLISTEAFTGEIVVHPDDSVDYYFENHVDNTVVGEEKAAFIGNTIPNGLRDVLFS